MNVNEFAKDVHENAVHMDGGTRLGAFPRSPRSFIRKYRRLSRNGETETRLSMDAAASRALSVSLRALATRARKPGLVSRRV